MERVHWIAVAGVLGVAVLAGAWFGGRPEAPPPVSVNRPSAAAVAGETPSESITVHVSGAVAAPGLVELRQDARVADALAAACGASGAADLSALNLASRLFDGGQVVVPLLGEATPGGAVSPENGPLRLNVATAAQLEDLPGVGPITAQRIITHRESNGPFRVVEDLLDVPGIGESKLAALRDLVVVP